MASPFKAWQERFKKSKAPVVKQLDVDFAGLKRGMMMLVSSPEEIDAYIRTIPHGEARPMNQLRAELAHKHNADATCPASTAIFLRVVAEAACEGLQSGKALDSITPFWRVVEPGSRLAQKLTCGSDFLEALREREGIQ